MINNIIHISLDLETWGKKPGCDIRSIGAVVFDPATGTIGKASEAATTRFYIATDNPLSKDDQLASPEMILEWDQNPDCSTRPYKLTRDPETVKWWNDQSAEAQSAFANPIDLWQACYDFRHWVWSVSNPTERFENWKPGENIEIWANGPQFDCSILEAVYDAVRLPVPWHYRAPRDFRTITMDAAGMTYDEFSEYGEPHHALHDAIAQAMTICEAFKRIGRQRLCDDEG